MLLKKKKRTKYAIAEYNQVIFYKDNNDKGNYIITSKYVSIWNVSYIYRIKVLLKKISLPQNSPFTATSTFWAHSFLQLIKKA